MIKKHLITLSLMLLIISSMNLSGQTLIRSSMSSLGSTISGDGFIIRQTVGQPSSTFSGKNGLLVLRSGFQQPLLSKSVIPVLIPLSFTLYPNPARERTLLEFPEEISTYNMVITSVNGRVVSRLNDQTPVSNWIDLSEFAPGLYIVTITSDIRSGSRKLIVKQ